MTNFWLNLEKPFFILAPMEAVTDVVFRHVIKKAASPDAYFTEFTNATGWAKAGNKAVAGRLDKTDEQPIVAQIWGSIPEDIAKLAKHCKQIGYNGVDINMGCPDSSAIKSGGGAALIQNHQLTSEIINVAKTSELPVSVKTRLGYYTPDEYKQWIEFLLKQDIVALTVHLRTKREMSKVPAHHELLSEIVKIRNSVAPKTLIIANGDIHDRQHGLEIVKKYGVDGIMIGRGVFSNPYAFEKLKVPHAKEELISLLKTHLDLFEARGEKQRKFETLKRFFKIYIRDFEGASELRNSLMQTTNTEEVRQILQANRL